MKDITLMHIRKGKEKVSVETEIVGKREQRRREVQQNNSEGGKEWRKIES